LHDYQVSKQGKIRDFVPGFIANGDASTRQTTEYDLGTISLPFLFYIGEDSNNVCNLTDAKAGATLLNQVDKIVSRPGNVLAYTKNSNVNFTTEYFKV